MIYFSVIALIQACIIIITVGPILQPIFITPPRKEKPSFIYNELKVAEMQVGYLVPKRQFNKMNLIAIYISSLSTPSMSYSLFCEKISQLIENKRSLLSSIWGPDFSVYIMHMNSLKGSLLVNDLIPQILEKSGKSHANSDILHYVYIEDPFFKPSSIIVDGFGVIDYQTTTISDFIPTNDKISILKIAISRLLECRTLENFEYERVIS